MQEPEGLQDLVQDVRVVGVAEDGCDVHVDLLGGPERVVASVRFTFADAVERAANVRRLRRWCHEGRAVTLTTTTSSIRLLDEGASFARQLG